MKQYQKGIFVLDFLQELGLSMLIIGKALEDTRLNKSYRVIKCNPTRIHLKMTHPVLSILGTLFSVVGSKTHLQATPTSLWLAL